MGARCQEGAGMTWAFDPLPRRHFSACVIDPPWRFSAGTKSRPQHYPRMTLADIAALPVRELLLPEGGRVFLWITAPLLDKVDMLARSWRLRYCTTLPWLKLWPSESGLFIYANSLARGTGYEVQGNAEYVVILKAGKPQSIKGKPFPGIIATPRYIFDALGCRFDMDVAAPFEGPRHVPCDTWIYDYALIKPWHGFVWMNPPFGGRNGLEPWLEKFFDHGDGIALTPDRTSAQWFQAAAMRADLILFVSPKIKFERPDGSIGKWPGTGTALMAVGASGVDALRNASGKIGFLAKPTEAA